jgi:hypothetical protein
MGAGADCPCRQRPASCEAAQPATTIFYKGSFNSIRTSAAPTITDAIASATTAYPITTFQVARFIRDLDGGDNYPAFPPSRAIRGSIRFAQGSPR